MKKAFSKKVISILLSLVVVLAALPLTAFPAFAEEAWGYVPPSGQCGNNVTYTFDSATGELVISGSGSMYNYSIYKFDENGYEHCNSPFGETSNINTVVIENGVTSIGKCMFWDCRGLRSITIPQSVTSIGESAFEGCTHLRSVELPGGVTKISANTFSGCHELTTVTIGTGVTKIEKGAFTGCGHLTTVNYAGTQSDWDHIDINYIGNSHLFRVKSQSHIISGREDNITYEVNPTTHELLISGSGSISYGLFNGDAFINTLVITNGITGVDAGAFQYCPALTSVTFGPDVNSLQTYAFVGCTSLRNVALAGNISDCGTQVFKDCTALESAVIGQGVSLINSYMFDGCKKLSYVSLPSTLKNIRNNAFSRCTSLTSIDLPYGLESIAASAFANTGLTSITIPGSVTGIGESAFYGCKNLANIVVSGGNTVYDSRNSCKAIIKTATNELITGCKNTVIPDTVTAIGKNAFGGCSGLSSITIPDSVTTIGEQAFNYCTGLTSVTISDGVTTIGEDAFSNCNSLTDATIPGSVTTIGMGAFKNCNGLTSLTISDGVTSIGEGAFEHCYSLKNITIPNSVTSIGKGAFNDCTDLTSALLGNGITTIPEELFYGCSNLNSIFIPSSVTAIDKCAFAYCFKLDDAYYSGAESEWNNITIENFEGWNGVLVNHAAKHFNSGYCGDSAFYEYGLATNEIMIGGMGAMYDYNSSNPGYHPFRSAVSKITVSEGITRIGAYTFYEMQNATSVTIPSTVTHINANAFRDCNSLSDVYYLGSQDDWNDLIIGANNEALTNATLHISETGACGDNATYCYNAQIGALTIRGTGDMYDYENDFAPWHNYRSSITSVTVEEGITSIGDYAFGDTNITEFTIPASVTEIGARALQNCRGLTEIDIHEGITAIGEAAFDGCRGLTRVIIPEGVTTVSYAAFYNCTGLTEVTLPFSVAAIGDYAFDGCSSLADIYYPGTKRDWYGIDTGNNESILDGAVRHYEIYTITGEFEDTDIEWKYNPVTCVLTLSGEGEMQDNLENPWVGFEMQIKKIVIEDGITRIARYAFYGYSSVEAVCISNSVTSIGFGTFDRCSSLTDVYYNGTQSAWEEITIDTDNDRLTNATMHYGKSGWCGILDYYYEPSGDVQYHFNPCTATLTIYGTGAMANDWAPWGNSSAGTVRNDMKTVEIEDGVTHIGEGVFINNRNIEIVIIGPDVTSIGVEAFLNCNKIVHVFYDGSQADWNNISISAGNDCLTNATIHFSETGVCGDNAKYALNLFTEKLTITGTGDIYDYSANSPFDSDPRIGSVVIGDGITRIGGWAFNGCANITSVKMPSTLTSVGEYAFRTCAGLKGVTIPDSVTAIENGAFTQCAGMKTLALSENLTTLGNYAFSSCEKLKVVRVPASITSFGSEVFSGCTGLTDARFLNGLTSIGIRAFEGCTSLTELTIPDSVQTIMNYAFAGCTALEFAAIGSGLGSQLTRVYTGAFNMCTELTGVLYFGTSADWYNITINNANLPLKDAVKQCCLDNTLTARCGTNVNWLLDVATGALTVSGTGDMFDYENGARPSFNQYAGMIKTAAVESGVTNVGECAFINCNELTSATLANTVTAIGHYAFEDCDHLETVNIPAGVTTIGSHAFSGCYELNGVSIPSSVTSIGQLAFNDCRALTQIAIPAGVTAINMATFAYCYALTSVTIPASVTVIDDGAFFDCVNLATVNYPGSDDDWCAVAIGDMNDPLLKVKPQIKTGSCGDSLTYVYNRATGTLTISGTGAMRNYTYDGANDAPFKDLPGLVKIEIGDGVTSIGTFAFADCATVTDIAFPKSADDLGNGFLYGCGALERLYCYGGYVCDSYFRTHGYTAELRLYGDTHVDTVFDALDYSAAVNASLDAANLSYEQKTIADYNRDGVVDALDCRLVKLLSQGKALPA